MCILYLVVFVCVCVFSLSVCCSLSKLVYFSWRIITFHSNRIEAWRVCNIKDIAVLPPKYSVSLKNVAKERCVGGECAVGPEGHHSCMHVSLHARTYTLLPLLECPSVFAQPCKNWIPWPPPSVDCTLSQYKLDPLAPYQYRPGPVPVQTRTPGLVSVQTGTRCNTNWNS